MNQQVKRLASRATAAFGALGLGAALTVVSLLSPAAAVVHAFPTGGQIQSRAIYMSSSTPSATSSYFVTFKPASTASIKGLVLDFCSSSPIVGDTSCGTPTGFTVGASPTVTTAATTAGTPSNYPLTTDGLPNGGGTWTASSANSGRTLELTNASGTGPLTTTDTYSFEVTGITNPSTTGTFYARVITYTSNTGDITTYAPGNESQSGSSTDAKDYGGFALSTANIINITAKVQETLSFCVTSVDLGAADAGNGGAGHQCGDATATATSSLPNLIIGHGSPVATINEQQVDVTPAYMQVSTNATTGAVVRMHATNACANGGLSATGGTSCAIPGIGAVGGNSVAAANQMVPGTAAFGLFVGTGYTTTAVPTSTGTITPATPYNDGSHTTETPNPNPGLRYGMDNTTGSGVTGTYGSLIATTAGAPCNTMNSHLVFGATASLTTPAGIYTTGESLIATGTF